MRTVVLGVKGSGSWAPTGVTDAVFGGDDRGTAGEDEGGIV